MARKPERRSEEWAPPLLGDAPSEDGEEVEEASPLAELDAPALREALGALTVTELRSQAKAWGVGLQGGRRKADLIHLLVEAKGGGGEPAPSEAPAELVLEDIRPSSEPPFGQLEDLWIEAANRLDRGDYRSAIALSPGSAGSSTTIRGLGSRWDVAGDLTVGNTAMGSLVVDQSGVLDVTGHLIVGIGSVTVSD